MVFAALVGGLVGSRVDYLIQNWDKVSDDLLGNIFSGSGLVWFGGLVGGALGVILWARWRRLLGWELFDTAAVPLAVGYAIGRVGCQLSGDGDYGTQSDLPWAMSYPDGTVPTTDEVHPTPVYETLAMGLAGLVLWRLRDRVAPGVLFGLYLMIAGIERFLWSSSAATRTWSRVSRRRSSSPLRCLRSARGSWPCAAPCRAPQRPERAAERGRRAEGQRHRRAGGAVRVEGDLHADDAGEHRDRGAAQHRARGRARVLPHRDRRRDQDREHQQRAEALDRDGDGRREQHEQDEPHRGRAQALGRGAAGVEGDGGRAGGGGRRARRRRA